MSAELKIVRMEPADIAAVYAMELKVFEIEPWPIEWFSETISDPYGYFFLAYWGEELAGYCGMYHNTGTEQHFCKISTLAVSQDFRRKGIGRALMLKALDLAKELGLDRTKLEVNTNNNAAIELYEALGFGKAELIENYDKSGDAYIMWRYEIL